MSHWKAMVVFVLSASSLAHGFIIHDFGMVQVMLISMILGITATEVVP